MFRQQHPAPPSYGANPFVDPVPIYQTGPPVTHPRRDKSPLCNPRNNSDAQDVNPFRNPQMTQTGPIPLVAPRPGYATNISVLTLNHPSPAATPVGRLPGDTLNRGSPAIAVPQTPHPLQPPVTPITPVFVQPVKTSAVKFASKQPIMRGEKEETLLPKRGERGDQFWKRFSMVAKVESNKPSTWLEKTSGGQSRFSRWVLFLAIFLVSTIVGVSVLGWYMTRNNPGAPTAVGGGGDGQHIPLTTSSVLVGNLGGSTHLHVSPTLTVAKRGPSFTGVANKSGSRLSHRHKRPHRGTTHLQ